MSEEKTVWVRFDLYIEAVLLAAAIFFGLSSIDVEVIIKECSTLEEQSGD